MEKYPDGQEKKEQEGQSGGLRQAAEFWAAWEANEAFLLGLAMRWMRHPQEAREALSSSMMRAWEGLQAMQTPVGNYKAWLATIVRNHCVDLLRQHRPHSADPDALQAVPDRLGTGMDQGPETSLLHEENYLRLRREVERLPARLRDVMILRAYQDLPYKQIGGLLRISPDLARKRVQEARGILRDRLDRAPHDTASAPRGERRAAEEVQLRPRLLDDVRIVQCPSGTRMLLFLRRKPVRLHQKRQTARKYLQQHPASRSRRLSLALILLCEGRLAQAHESLMDLLDQHPEDHRLRQLNLQLRLALGLRADDLAQGGLRHDPAQATAWRMALAGSRGEALSEIGAFRQQRQARAGHWLTAWSYFRWLSASGAWPAAEWLALEFLREHPMDRQGWEWLHMAVSRQNKPARLAYLREEMLRKFPEDPLCRMRCAKGKALDRLERKHGPLAEWEEIVSSGVHVRVPFDL